MVDEARLRRLFLDLTAFDSPPGEEGSVGDYCAAALKSAGFETSRDTVGNLVAARGLGRPGQAIFLSGHLDTVAPTAGLAVNEANGVFRTNGRTILGADDKCAVAAILEAAYQIEEQGRPHAPLRIVLSVKEEVGLAGVKQMDLEPLRGSLGFVLDAAGPTGATAARPSCPAAGRASVGPFRATTNSGPPGLPPVPGRLRFPAGATPASGTPAAPTGKCARDRGRCSG